MPKFVLCGGCERHFHLGDPRCPFCGASSSRGRRRPSVALPPGASRSRRYAASALLLSNAGVLACGLTHAPDPERSASGGGANVAATGGGSAGKSSGGAPSIPTIRIPMPDPPVPATGDRACPGFEEVEGCRTRNECPQLLPRRETICVVSDCPSEELMPRSACPADGCPSGSVCQEISRCGDMGCLPECDPEQCSGDHECLSGICVPKNCGRADGAACPDGYACVVTELAYCAPEQCPDDYTCAEWQVCEAGGAADAHGCSPRPCLFDADCGSCGYCIEQSLCSGKLARCDLGGPIAMPYGCVWPDEEWV